MGEETCFQSGKGTATFKDMHLRAGKTGHLSSLETPWPLVFIASDSLSQRRSQPFSLVVSSEPALRALWC